MATTSESIRAGLQRAKANGVKLGSARPGHWDGKQRGNLAASAAAARKRRQKAAENNTMPARIAADLRSKGTTWRAIAETINRKGYRTTQGNHWTASKVYTLHTRTAAGFTHH